jgi:membrane protein implicated in regulation of membrane protease activity
MTAMTNSYTNNPRPRRRILVFRLSGARSGWLAKLLVPAALIALIPLALLLMVGLWAVLAIGAAVIATAALLGAPLLRRLRPKPPTQAHILEGEARRIDVAD